jgi:SAM-dependent methyltransferase
VSRVAGSHRASRPGSGLSSAPLAGPRIGMFTQFTADYAAQRRGRPLSLLIAGCATAGPLARQPASAQLPETGRPGLDLGWLQEQGCDIAVSLIDDDQPVTREVVAARPDLADATLGDLRTVPMVPRSVDIVYCCYLLHRIGHAELVLDRLVAAVRPGGLLLLATGDATSAAGFLDRRLPLPVRRALWQRQHPGEPGPYPAVYEPLASVHGIESYVTRRGLAIARRQVLDSIDGQRGAAGQRSARHVVAALSRGRLSAVHDDLRYVIRKPEDRFARIL